MISYLDAAMFALAAFFAWLVIWGGSAWGRQASDRKRALAWSFLTFEDADGEKLNEVWLQHPGKFAMEIAAWRLSREMRARLAGRPVPDASDSQPPPLALPKT